MKMIKKTKEQKRRRAILLAALCGGAVVLNGCASGTLSQRTKEEKKITGTEAKEDVLKNQNTEAFYAARAWQEGFLAAGSRGRIEKIAPDGSGISLETDTEEDFTALAVQNDTAVAVGDQGTVVCIGPDDRTEIFEAEGADRLESVCGFAGVWVIGTEEGQMLKTEDFQTWEIIQTEAAGAVTGLAADSSRCIAVTDQGEILVSTEGSQWEVLNYNEYYGESLDLQGIEVLDELFWAFGRDEKGASKVIMSTEGGVWSERMLQIYEDNTCIEGSEFGVNSLTSDGEQILAGCENGTVVTLPGCSVCNKREEISQVSIYAVAYNQGKLLAVGDDYSIQIKEGSEMRQERIKDAAALEKQKEGAAIIDVRSREEYEEKHIAGSIHIPLEEVEEQLPVLYPDTNQELIFYCLSGVRSQTALEKAGELGYTNIYNLGGIDDWSYEVVKQK